MIRSKGLNKIRLVWSYIEDAMFPKTCPMCDAILDKGISICSECKEKLRYIEEPRCKKCGKQLNKEEQEWCYDCANTIHMYKTGLAAFRYDGLVSKSIYKFKYHNRRTYAEFYGEAIAKRYGAMVKRWDADVLIPVPIHQKKMQVRGYNQAELIAKQLGLQLGMKVDSRYLKRVKQTRALKELNKIERKKNLENAFKICSNVVKYKKVILVDDIYTTGSTIDECARILMNAGVREIYFISLSVGAGI